jgi:hypothetical protein
VAKEEREARAERPRPPKRRRSPVRPRLVCSSPSVVCIDSSKSRFTRDTALVLQLPSTRRLFSSILQPKSWSWQGMRARISRSSESRRDICSLLFVVTRSWMLSSRLLLLVEVLFHTFTSRLLTRPPRAPRRASSKVLFAFRAI